MRPSLVAIFLLLSLVLTKVQGGRMKKMLVYDDKYHKIHEGLLMNKYNGGVEDHVVVNCIDENCFLGKNRKLMNIPTSTTTTTTSKKNVKSGENEPKPTKTVNEILVGKVENLPVHKHREADHEPYPDIIDIAGMDYSPARRKTPIHN